MTQSKIKASREKSSHLMPSLGCSSAPQALTGVLLPENYRFLQQEIRRECGIILDDDKHYLFESRLAPILRGAKLSTLNELCAQLRTRRYPSLSQLVMEALTTNETYFFRDMAPFEALRTQLLPALITKLASDAKLRIWSAAASSGQEAYSIAILLRELDIHDRTANILGTDISEQILTYAQEAKYLQFEINRGLPIKYLAKYFKKDGMDWRLNDEIRNMVQFRRFDLRQSANRLGHFHIIFCRNVLIYFDIKTKNRIIQQLVNSLETGGYLILGAAESIQNQQYNCIRIEKENTVIYCKQW